MACVLTNTEQDQHGLELFSISALFRTTYHPSTNYFWRLVINGSSRCGGIGATLARVVLRTCPWYPHRDIE